ncbi:MAG: ATP-dependent zinc metalloprotease FtsH [Pseudomonadota bacterium]
MKQSYKTILIWVIILAGLFFVYNLWLDSSNNQVVGYHIFKSSDIPSGKVRSVAINLKTNKYEYKILTDKGDEEGRVTFGPYDEGVRKELEEKGIKVSYMSKDEGSFMTSLLVTYLPLILIVVIFFIMMRQIQVGSGKAMSFGKSRARLVDEKRNRVTFRDVAGIDEVLDELEEIIDFLKNPKKFQRLGGRIPKGVLLMGAPGTGKTLLARAIAGEAGVPFFSISGSDFVEMFVGVGASRVRDLFEQGKKNAPCIIFIDEIDAVGRLRGAGLGGGHDEREQTLNQLLVEMDGFESNDGVIIIAATNRPDVLDPAILRAGRFDRRIVVPRPDLTGRIGILKVHTRKITLDEELDLEVVARGTPGFSGADLENLANEAALLAARVNKDQVELDDFDLAKDKLLMGSERRSMVISEKEKRTTAYHEAGHTLVARMVPGTDPVHKVTIIPRGRALGATQQLPEEDRYNVSKEFSLNQITILMGGRLAEEIFLNQQTTGAGQDIEQASEIARKMVCEWGMSDKIGPMALGRKDEAIFLGREIAQHQDYSERTAIEIDTEVRGIIMGSYERAKTIILDNRQSLERLVAALLEYEVLDTAEIDMVIEGKPLARSKQWKKEKRERKEKGMEEVKDGEEEGEKSPVFTPVTEDT